MSKKIKRYPELNALKGLIRERGSSYREVAREIGIEINTLSDKINGFQAISVPEIEKISLFLDIDPKDVVKFFMPSYCTIRNRKGGAE
jgi:transcriptional regulator with XRE-family HTH domain